MAEFGGGATKRVREVVDQVRERAFPYVRRPRTRVPWPLYDRAQTREVPDMLELIRILVDRYAWEHPEAPLPRPSRGGQPPVPLPDRLKVLLAQSYLGLPNRPTEGEVTVLRGSLGLSRYFGYKTVERSYGDPRIVAALYALFELTNRPVKGLETTFAADGTGFPTAIGQHYRGVRGRQREQEREQGLLPGGGRDDHDWVYNEATVGLRYGLFAGWVSWTDHSVGELGKFEGVARQTKALHDEWNRFLGDGGFSARWVVGMLDRMGVQAWILPRRNVRLTSLGEPAWPRSLQGMARDPQEWLSIHFQRVRIETTWWSVASRNSGRIRKRLSSRRETEAMLRGVVRNLRRLCYLRWLEQDPKFTAFAPPVED